jgi:hypothetical protein
MSMVGEILDIWKMWRIIISKYQSVQRVLEVEPINSNGVGNHPQ